jgi:hypothetical protein
MVHAAPQSTVDVRVTPVQSRADPRDPLRPQSAGDARLRGIQCNVEGRPYPPRRNLVRSALRGPLNGATAALGVPSAGEPGRSVYGERANFTALVIGVIEADLCN